MPSVLPVVDPAGHGSKSDLAQEFFKVGFSALLVLKAIPDQPDSDVAPGRWILPDEPPEVAARRLALRSLETAARQAEVGSRGGIRPPYDDLVHVAAAVLGSVGGLPCGATPHR